jgi:hypothetical protein
MGIPQGGDNPAVFVPVVKRCESLERMQPYQRLNVLSWGPCLNCSPGLNVSESGKRRRRKVGPQLRALLAEFALSRCDGKAQFAYLLAFGTAAERAPAEVWRSPRWWTDLCDQCRLGHAVGDPERNERLGGDDPRWWWLPDPCA